MTRTMMSTALVLSMISGTTLAQQGSTPPPQTADPVILEQPHIQWVTPQRPVRPGVQCVVNAVDVDVRITDAIARTEMKVTVQNYGSSRSQAQLVLPVPAGATISTFGIDGIGDEPTAQLLPRAEATRRYHEIVRSMTDPGLLEFVGNAMIQSSVFPVEPGGQRTMTIVYEQSLEAHGGRVEYVLPRSASMASNHIGWTIDIEVESSGAMGPVFSPSHPIVTKPVTDKLARVGVPVLSEPGAFRLYAMLGSGDQATTLLYPDADDPDSGYFMFVADAPTIAEQQDQGLIDRIQREITIVIDRSGSMNGEKIVQARESAKQVVRGMNMGEFIRVIDYADDVRSFSDQAVELTPESVEQIVAYIDNIQSRGGTNLHGALMESLRAQATPNTLPMVLFLTDGLATIGTTDEASIRKDAQGANASERRVFTFGVGYDVNAPLLDGIAMDTRADSTFVLPGEDVEMKVGQVFDKLDGPVMIDPVFIAYPQHAAPAADLVIPRITSVEPSELSDLFSGSRVVILGRYEGGQPMRLQLASRGEQDASKRITAVLDPEQASNRYAFVARLWAQERINALLKEIRLASADGSQPNQELVDEIVRLSLEHGIMSEYTAFLADETMDLARAASAPGRMQTRLMMIESNNERTGSSGVAQSQNRKNQDSESLALIVDKAEAEQGDDYAYSGAKVQRLGQITSNTYYDANMRQISVQTVQRGLQGTIYRKNNQWVDAQLGQEADQEPDQTVEFDTEAYWTLLEDLTAQNRQWILGNRGDIYLLNHGQRVLVKNPQ
ncbi:MAG: VWA domain-containing protein [Phycisphaerales bacterium]|nr:VWA domain-containing protein [Phycisphaerales bacterium]